MSTPQQQIIEQLPSGLKASRPNIDDLRVLRYGWSAGSDIDLTFRTGSSFCGNYPDEKIPRRVLVPFTEAYSLAINELPAVVGSSFEQLDSQDTLGILEVEGDDRPNSRVVRNPSKRIAYWLMKDYENVGMCLFEHMKGQENWEELQHYYNLLLPASAFAEGGPLAPITKESVLRESVTRTFLHQYRSYFMTDGSRNVARAGLSRTSPVEGSDESPYARCSAVLRELTSACNRAYAHQRKVLEESELEIRKRNNGGKGKPWYDERDSDFLLETNKKSLTVAQFSGDSTTAVSGVPADLGAQIGQAVGAAIRGASLEPHVSPGLDRVLQENAELKRNLDRVMSELGMEDQATGARVEAGSPDDTFDPPDNILDPSTVEAQAAAFDAADAAGETDREE